MKIDSSPRPKSQRTTCCKPGLFASLVESYLVRARGARLALIRLKGSDEQQPQIRGRNSVHSGFEPHKSSYTDESVATHLHRAFGYATDTFAVKVSQSTFAWEHASDCQEADSSLLHQSRSVGDIQLPSFLELRTGQSFCAKLNQEYDWPAAVVLGWTVQLRLLLQWNCLGCSAKTLV